MTVEISLENQTNIHDSNIYSLDQVDQFISDKYCIQDTDQIDKIKNYHLHLHPTTESIQLYLNKNKTLLQSSILFIPAQSPITYFISSQNNSQQSDNFLNSQPCSTWFVNKTSQKINTPGCHYRAPKRHVALSENAQDFKNEYYSIFTKKKKFEKKFVKDIHDCFLIEKLNLDKMTREEIRRIDIYFRNYADRKEEILKVLREYKNEISQKFLNFSYNI